MQQINGLQNNVVDPSAVGRCPAVFSWRSKQIDPSKPECRKVPYITILVPGGFVPEVIERPVKEQDKLDYPLQWAAFEKGGDQSELGWPIEKSPFLDIAQAQTYKLMGIPTMEALAGASDSTIQGMMGGLAHRDKARAMVKAATDAGPMLDLVKRNEDLESKVDLQTKQIDELCKEMEKLKKAKGADK